MIDHETLKELLKETVEPCEALEIAIQMEMGAQNHQKINQNLMSTTNSVNVVNNYQSCNRNDFTRYPTVPQNYQYSSICMNCGLRWSHKSQNNHRDKHIKPRKQTSIKLISLPKKVTTRNPLTT